MATLEDVRRFVRANAGVARGELESRLRHAFDLSDAEAAAMLRDLEMDAGVDAGNVDARVEDSGEVPAGVMAWRDSAGATGAPGIAGSGAAPLGERAGDAGWREDDEREELRDDDDDVLPR